MNEPLVVNDHVPVILTNPERMDLASITKHPGMTVLVEKIMRGHAQQQLAKIYSVKPDDPNRVAKLDAISAVAYAMQAFLTQITDEMTLNWNHMLKQENKQ